MDLIELFREIDNENFFEMTIYDIFKGMNKNQVIMLSGNLLLDTINIKARSFKEVEMFLNTFRVQNDDSFGGVIIGVYYIFIYERSFERTKNNLSIQVATEIVEIINKFKEILFYYLIQGIGKSTYVRELFFIQEKVIQVSDKFHDKLHDYLTQYHREIIDYVTKRLTGI